MGATNGFGSYRVAFASFVVVAWVVQGVAVASSGGAPARAVALQGAVAKLGFGEADVAALAQGRATARTIESSNEAELAAVGLVVLPASVDAVTASFSDLTLLEQAGMVVEAQRFTPDGGVGELAPLELPGNDAKNLLKAKVADSDVKLSGAEIASIRGRVPPAHVESYKRALADRLAAWRQSGLDGLGTYADKKRLVVQTDVSKAMLAEVLATRPGGPLHLADDFQYWAVVKIGDFKPLVELNHVSLYRGNGFARIETVQIYASHYCEGLVTSVDLVELPATNGAATLMRLTFRAQVDALGGFFGGLKRSIGKSRVVEQVAHGLERVRSTVGSVEFARASAARRSAAGGGPVAATR